MENIKKEILMKNNVLTKARYDLHANENKIFHLILFNLQKEDNSTLVAHIPKSKFEELFKSSKHKTEKAIRDVLLKLRKGDIWIITANKWHNYGFINDFGFNKETNTFEIYANKKLYDLLFDYLKGYTPVNLQTFFSFKSYYSQRMYELLRLWSNTKLVINYTIQELKELMMLEDKYPIYRDFKRRIITSSIKELNEKGLMNIEFKENKINRKVVSIDFIITDKDQRKYFENKKESTYIKNTLDHQQEQKNYNKPKDLKFKNFDERKYDYPTLERKLLGWDNYD